MSTAAPARARLKERYQNEVVPALMREFGYTNVMQVPKLEKAVLNIGLGEAITNAKAIDAAVGDLQQITGQKPVVTRAKRSVAAFKLRTGMPIGVKVTLRGDRMYEFVDRLVNVALPRIRDFRGVSPNAFDGRGNFTLGMTEQIAFVTTARNDEEGRRLLALLGMPFRAPGAEPGGR